MFLALDPIVAGKKEILTDAKFKEYLNEFMKDYNDVDVLKGMLFSFNNRGIFEHLQPNIYKHQEDINNAIKEKIQLLSQSAKRPKGGPLSLEPAGKPVIKPVRRVEQLEEKRVDRPIEQPIENPSIPFGSAQAIINDVNVTFDGGKFTNGMISNNGDSQTKKIIIKL